MSSGWFNTSEPDQTIVQHREPGLQRNLTSVRHFSTASIPNFCIIGSVNHVTPPAHIMLISFWFTDGEEAGGWWFHWWPCAKLKISSFSSEQRHVNKESVLYYDTIIRYHQVLLLNIMKHTNIGACKTWIIYYMDWKRDILRVEISDAILVKRCHDDLRNKITETVLKTAQKLVETLHKLRTIIITWWNTTNASSECIF